MLVRPHNRRILSSTLGIKLGSVELMVSLVVGYIVQICIHTAKFTV